MSNRSRGQVLASHVAQDGVDLTSNISFEATDDLKLCHSFARTTAHILLGWLMVVQAHEDDAIEGSVGLAVAQCASGAFRGAPSRCLTEQMG